MLFTKFFVPLRSGKTSSIHIKDNKMENRSLVTIAEHSKEKNPLHARNGEAV